MIERIPLTNGERINISMDRGESNGLTEDQSGSSRDYATDLLPDATGPREPGRYACGEFSVQNREP
jgi:hypothetical protein